MIRKIIEIPIIVFFRLFNWFKKTREPKKPPVTRERASINYNIGYRDGIRDSFKQIETNLSEILKKYQAELDCIIETNQMFPQETTNFNGDPTHSNRSIPIDIEYHIALRIRPQKDACILVVEKL